MARKRGGIADWIAQASIPVIVLDARRRIRVFNRGAVGQTGVQPGEVLGRRCDIDPDHPRDGAGALLDALAIHETQFAGAPRWVELALPAPDDGDRIRHGVLVPLVDPDQDSHTLVLIVPEPPVAIASAVELATHHQLRRRAIELADRYQVKGFVAGSAAAERNVRQLAAAAQSNVATLICGPRGSGRTHAANTLHRLKWPQQLVDARRESLPDVSMLYAVDGRLSSASELEEQLERIRRLAEPTSGGPLPTLLCENVDEWPSENVKQLQGAVVETSLGGCTQLVGTAEFAPMRGAVADLFSDVVVRVSALRDRSSDIRLLAQHFVDDERAFADESHRPAARGFDEQTQLALEAYSWPGNVVELRRVVLGALENAAQELISVADLPSSFRAGQDAETLVPIAPIRPLADVLEDAERQQIRAALVASGGDKRLAAKKLCISRPKLYRRIEALGLETGE